MRTTVAFLILTLVGIAHAAEKPNVIIIYADDMGYGDCTVNNPESKIPTPNIDRLAKEGLRFTDAHSPSTTCTASRYGLLTGINPARRGVVNGINRLGPVLEAKELTIAEMLKAQGYSTNMVGKWHLGFELAPAEGRRPVLDLSKSFVGGPLDHGFDSFLGVNSAISSGPYYYIRNRGPEVLPTESTKGTKASGWDRRETYAESDLAPGFVHEEVNSRLCDEVIGIIQNHSAKNDPEPLFLYYAMLEPHTPWLPEEQFAGKSGAGPYGDYVAQLDHEIGRVLKALKDSGLENDTLVFFSSDNGALWPEADIKKYGHRANGPLAGGKARPEEGGHRVPFIARWPGQIPAGTTTDALINHTDMLATLAELVGVKDVDGETRVDSHSFLPVLREPDVQHQRPAMAVTTRSFRDGDWKLNFNRGNSGPDERDVDQASLYNLADDLGETLDLSQTQPERKQQLFAAYREYFADLKLKPLAIQVAERKKNVKTQPESARARRAGARPKAPSSQPNVELSKEQQAKVAALKKEFGQRRAELQKQLDDLLTDDQKQARDQARKKALAEGKGGVKLRTVMDAALNLAPAQQKTFNELRQSLGQLTRSHRAELDKMLRDLDERENR
ncbi:MAG: sulfatase-like hydrolase/transferase [Planctomycetaceae bacterium]